MGAHYLATAKGKCIRFSVTDVRVFTSRNSQGVRGIRLAKGDEVATDGGLLGKVTDLGDNFALLEVTEGVQVKTKALANSPSSSDAWPPTR